MESKSYQPYILSLGLMVLASLVIALTVAPAPVGDAGVMVDGEGNPVLPERFGDCKLYRNSEGRLMLCSIVLSGSDRGSIHRPEVCLPGQGFVIQDSALESVPLGDEEASERLLSTRRLLISKEFELRPNQSIEFFRYYYYWFVGSDLTTPHHGDRLYRATLDRILHNLSHRWAYVTVSPDMIPPGKESEIAAVCRDFIREIFPHFHRDAVIPR